MSIHNIAVGTCHWVPTWCRLHILKFFRRSLKIKKRILKNGRVSPPPEKFKKCGQRPRDCSLLLPRSTCPFPGSRQRSPVLPAHPQNCRGISPWPLQSPARSPAVDSAARCCLPSPQKPYSQPGSSPPPSCLSPTVRPGYLPLKHASRNGPKSLVEPVCTAPGRSATRLFPIDSVAGSSWRCSSSTNPIAFPSGITPLQGIVVPAEACRIPTQPATHR